MKNTPSQCGGSDTRRQFELGSQFYLSGALATARLELEVSDVYAFGTAVQIELRAGAQIEWVALEGFACRKDSIYIAVSQSPDLSDRLEKQPIVALRVAASRVFTVTAEELDDVFYDLHVSIQREEGKDRRLAEIALGRIRDWS